MNFEFLADGFYSYRPAMLSLFYFCALKLHEDIRIKINVCWNLKHDSLKSFEIQDFIKATHGYYNTLARWGIEDQHERVISEPLILTLTS